MAKITTEKGRCKEYDFHGLNAVLVLLGGYKPWREPERQPSFAKHSLRIYEHTVDICKRADFRKKFTEYKKEDIISITKSYKVNFIPVLLLILSVCLIIWLKMPEFLLFCLIFIPVIISRCIKIKVKNRLLPITLTYIPGRYTEMIDKILRSWNAK